MWMSDWIELVAAVLVFIAGWIAPSPQSLRRPKK